jgi:N-acetylneuraminic acid mutarotase
MLILKRNIKFKMTGGTNLFQQKLEFTMLSGVLAVICLLGMTSISLAQGDVWVQKTDIPTARLLHCSSVVDGLIYVIGGCTSEPNAQPVLTLEAYDPVTDSWSQKTDMITGRVVLSTCVVDGKIYAIGGVGINLVGLTAVEMYDPDIDTWTAKADMPTSRGALSISAVNGKIYAIGGTKTLNNMVGLSTVEMYDPVTDTWITKADMPTPRLGLCTEVVDGKIYAIGGSTGSPAGPIVEMYDPATDTWTKKADMPTARRNFAMSVVEGKIYAIGGWVKSTLYAFWTVEQYDPITDKWTSKTDLPNARSCLSASKVDGKIYVIAGTNKIHPCPALSTVYAYDANSDTAAVTSINDLTIQNPVSFRLDQNYPNPFNPQTRIKYELLHAGKVVLKVYNIVGQEICTLVDEVKPAGLFEVEWDGRDNTSHRVASGMYLYRIEGQGASIGSGKGFVQTRKMLLLE